MLSMVYPIMLVILNCIPGWYAAYQQDDDTRDFVHMIMSLSLLPPKVIPQAFECIQSMAKSRASHILLDYYLNNWINKWTPASYSVYKRKIRTNNDIEGESNVAFYSKISIP